MPRNVPDDQRAPADKCRTPAMRPTQTLHQEISRALVGKRREIRS